MAGKADQSQLSFPAAFFKHVPGSIRIKDLTPFLIGFDIVKCADIQPLTTGLLQDPVQFAISPLSVASLQLSCEDKFLTSWTQLRNCTGKPIRFATPVEIPHTTFKGMKDIINSQVSVSPGRQSESRYNRKIL